jgi:broad specificity phosphatase PhoE
MKVFFLRHATRDFTIGDVPLNKMGLQQAQQLTLNKDFQSIKTILCSPKKRAQMTVQPLADHLSIKIIINENLDQLKSGEFEEDFSNRVKSLLNKLTNYKDDQPILVCTHSDWLSSLMNIVPTDGANINYHVFECAEYMTFEYLDEIWYKI